VGAFHCSWKKQQDLKSKQAQLELGIKEYKLISAVKTHWAERITW